MEKWYNGQTDRGRSSGVELLKIFAIILIVVSHAIGEFTDKNPYISRNDYIMHIEAAAVNMQQIILTILSYCGMLGNAVFFICSAWFLLDSKKVRPKKILFMILEIWSVSVAFLIISFFLMGNSVRIGTILSSLMPTVFGNNWYLTCYILFYPIHTVLNKIIYSMSQKQLLTAAGTLFILYCCFNFIKDGLFFASPLILWVTIYFILGYVKLYLNDFSANLKLNYLCLGIGILSNVGLILFTNFLGLHIGLFSDKLLYWRSNCNPFLILIAISSLMIANRAKFVNGFINQISKLSLLVYIVHNNVFLRTYFIPLIFIYIYDNFGYDEILLWVLAVAAAMFLLSIIVSWLYTVSLQKLIVKITDKLYNLLCKVYDKVTEKLMLIH